MHLDGLDRWLTTEPEDRQNDLRADDEREGCPDCGHDPCDCDDRCPNCGFKYRSKAEADFGQCWECRMDQAESQRAE